MLQTLVLALTVAAPALKEKPRAEPPSVVGEWVVESRIVGGAPGHTTNRWVFRPDWTHQILDGAKVLAEGTYTTNPKADPLSLDLDPTAADGVYPCIFKVEGDVLTLNVGWQKAPRPTAFESVPGSKCTLYVFKRVKKDQ